MTLDHFCPRHGRASRPIEIEGLPCDCPIPLPVVGVFVCTDEAAVETLDDLALERAAVTGLLNVLRRNPKAATYAALLLSKIEAVWPREWADALRKELEL